MSAKSLTLAKSLHTVSVLVNVAKLAPSPIYGADMPAAMVARYRVGFALEALGYAGAADPHMLAARAVAILESGK